MSAEVCAVLNKIKINYRMSMVPQLLLSEILFSDISIPVLESVE